MVLKNLFIAIVCSALQPWSGVSMADEYRADQYLGLDLSEALISPKPLGPPTELAPLPVQAEADRGGELAQAPAEAKVEPREPEPRIVIHQSRVIHQTRVAHTRQQKPRVLARTELARRQGNPLDAQAFDTRIQVWPCRSGGICNWKRSGDTNGLSRSSQRRDTRL
jgi:hypothetical protein